MKKSRMKLIIPIAAAAAVILAAVLAVCLSGGGNEIMHYENSINYVYANEEGSTRFFVNEKLLDDKIGGRVDSFLSCDGKVGLARAGTGLYRIDKDGILKIYPAGVDRALLSLDNETIVFTTATEVHIYDHRTGSLEDIKPEGIVGIASIVISPSGSTIGYSVKKTDGVFYAYAYENGQSRKLSNDAYIMAVADGARFWYYIRPDEVELYYASENNERKLGTNVSSMLEFNRELTEVTFDMNGVTYCSVNGSAAKTLIDGASVFSTVAECESMQGGESCQSSVKGCSTLFGGVFYSFRNSSSNKDARTVYDLWYVDGARNVTQLVKGAYQFYLTEDRESLSCLVDDSVYSMNAKDPAKRNKICSGVYTFCVTRDGSQSYCVGYDLNLYYVKGKDDPIRIATDVVYAMITRDGKCLFLNDYDKAGSLHMAVGTNITDIDENVAHVESMPGAVFYYSGLYEDETGSSLYDVYCSKDGNNFIKAVEKALMDPNKD